MGSCWPASIVLMTNFRFSEITLLQQISVDFYPLHLHMDGHTCTHMHTNCICNWFMSFTVETQVVKVAKYVSDFINCQVIFL